MAVFSTPDPPPEDAKESEDCDNSAAMASTRRMFDCGVWRGVQETDSVIIHYSLHELNSELVSEQASK